jgi:hypothetical protein
MRPAVSVLMPVRNGLPWIREALAGLAAQTLSELEIIVLEDGSTDGTREFLDSWHDDRLRVIPTGGIGISAALNIGLGAACAPLVARHDADDVSVPHRLQAQAEYLNRRPDVGVLGTVAAYIDANGKSVENDWVHTVRQQQDVALEPAQIRDLMPLTCCLTHGSVMARTALLRAANGYRDDAAPAEDYDLWLRLLPRTAFAKLPDRLYQYRVHDLQVSSRRRDEQLLQTLTVKLQNLRRVCPQLPSPACLMVAGSGRGAAYYRALASCQGFTIAPTPPPLTPERLSLLDDPTVRTWMLEACDVLVVANFSDLDAYLHALAPELSAARLTRVGNFFVPVRWVEDVGA